MLLACHAKDRHTHSMTPPSYHHFIGSAGGGSSLLAPHRNRTAHTEEERAVPTDDIKRAASHPPDSNGRASSSSRRSSRRQSHWWWRWRRCLLLLLLGPLAEIGRGAGAFARGRHGQRAGGLVHVRGRAVDAADAQSGPRRVRLHVHKHVHVYVYVWLRGPIIPAPTPCIHTPCPHDKQVARRGEGSGASLEVAGEGVAAVPEGGRGRAQVRMLVGACVYGWRFASHPLSVALRHGILGMHRH